MNYAPHDYQTTAEQFVLDRPESALFLDCGLGKSAITLSVLRQLLTSGESKGALVVAPLRVARLTWPLEIDKWDQFMWMKTVFIHGKYKLAKLNSVADIYLINYEGLIWLAEVLASVKPSQWPFDTIVWDELTKIKAPSTRRFKDMKKVIGGFKRRIGLTATPTANGYQDLYGQLYMLDKGERLGRTHTAFKGRFMHKPNAWEPYRLELKPHAEKQITELVQDVCLRMENTLENQGSEVIDIDLVLPPSARSKYQKLQEDLFVQLKENEVEAINAAALCGKCLQMASGAVYHDDEGSWEEVHDTKLKALQKVVTQVDGPVLIAYSFKHEAERLLKCYPDAVVLKSGLASTREQEILKQWNAGKIPMLITHPASAGHGLNLQFGGSTIVWFTINWSLELYYQFNRRIDRQGQKEKVRIYRLIMSDTVDEVVATAVEDKDRSQKSFLKTLIKYRDELL